MTTRIVITNDGSWLNRGNGALLHSRISALRKQIPDAQFSIFTFNPDVPKNLEGVKVYKVIGTFKIKTPHLIILTLYTLIRCLIWALINKCFHIDIKVLRKGERLSEYKNADVIISTGGDTLGEFYGRFNFLSYAVNLIYGVLLYRPVVIYAESIGPFKRWWNKLIIKVLLNRVKLITLREEISSRYLEELGIRKPPIYVTADSAFLLDTVLPDRVAEICKVEGITEDSKPIVGISVSSIISRYGFPALGSYKDKYHSYAQIMALLIDHIAEDLKATVVMIPHVTKFKNNDDRDVADYVCGLISTSRKVVSIKAEYTPEETKCIIGQCDLFIGARMHATIASTSLGVPTVAIAYSHKYHGIIGDMLGYERYVLDIRNEFNIDYLLSAVDDAWNHRTEIRKELESKVIDIKQRALLNAELVKDLIERERKNQISLE